MRAAHARPAPTVRRVRLACAHRGARSRERVLVRRGIVAAINRPVGAPWHTLTALTQRDSVCASGAPERDAAWSGRVWGSVSLARREATRAAVFNVRRKGEWCAMYAVREFAHMAERVGWMTQWAADVVAGSIMASCTPLKACFFDAQRWSCKVNG
eukprot:IDg18514t1